MVMRVLAIFAIGASAALASPVLFTVSEHLADLEAEGFPWPKLAQLG